MIQKIKYAYHTHMNRSSVNAVTYSLVPTGTVYDVTSVSTYLTIRSIMETSLICVKRHINHQGSLLHLLDIFEAAIDMPSAYQYSIHLTNLSCVGFCSSCAFNYFTEYFMLSRNGSVCFTFRIRMIK